MAPQPAAQQSNPVLHKLRQIDYHLRERRQIRTKTFKQ